MMDNLKHIAAYVVLALITVPTYLHIYKFTYIFAA